MNWLDYIDVDSSTFISRRYSSKDHNIEEMVFSMDA
jgi:hypothetical protein